MKYLAYLSSLRSTAFKLGLILAGLALLVPHTAHASRSLEAFGLDTVAGYSTLLSTNTTTPSTPVEFHVIKPDSSELFLSAETDLSGVARTDLYGYHTRQAGIYRVSVRPLSKSDFSTYNSFEIFPDQLSDARSSITTSDTSITADGVSAAYLTVEARDQYGNPLSDRLIQIISSRTTDQISKPSSQTGTDSEGQITFAITSEEVGVSTFSALDTVSGLILSTRPKIVFTQPLAAVERTLSTTLSASFLQTASAQEITGAVTRLQITDLPQTTPTNETHTFILTALDNEGNTVKNYTGTVFFSTTDPEATIPQRYTFTPEDLGSHEFELAIRFLTAGTHTLEATDWDDETITGSANILVTESTDTDITVTLDQPTAGTYTTTDLTLSGTGPALTDIELYDGRQKIQTVGTTVDGEYTYLTTDLTEGTHSFSAQTVDGQAVSETVYIDIDLSGAKIQTVYIDPTDPLTVNTPFDLYVETESNLPRVSAVFNHASYTLTELTEKPGTYTAPMFAPAEADNYPIDITLENNLGKTTEEKNAYTVQVEADQRFARVFGVVATPGNTKVDLTWSATPTATSYRIEYGLESGNYFDSFTSPTTSATVIDLVNGRTYFFIVTALDEDSEDLTEGPSEEVSATPYGPQPVLNLIAEPTDSAVDLTWSTYEKATNYRISFGIESGNYFDSFTTADATTSAQAYNLLNGTKYYFTVEALTDSTIISAPSTEATATPFAPITCIPTEVKNLTAQVAEDGTVTLNWSAATDSNIYTIYTGTTKTQLTPITKVTNTTTWSQKFTDGTHYFAVKTVCPELTEKPLDFQRIIKVNVGADLIISIFLSMLIFAAAWRLRLIPRHAHLKSNRQEIATLLEQDEYEIFK